MAVTQIDASPQLILDLDDPPAGHRLTELLQVLTGCSVERAELAISDPTPTGPTGPAMALDTMARAMASLRHGSTALLPQS